ncbi:nucleotidyltransferase family protein [Candidatus Magnetominusculus xianensis]|uniref:Nucleotidyltransferase n=1 Tax=Candidatus Magnetominusculus xianensis TaxID=1748249 RepID=A0ABR5SG31_9BACT|nr:nucleotidyltransferase family protein [Candidatus Magnetominusculus xianensis]KWT85084.1 putative nucleotidyltransferase [Candidatus Magnetominusculus xianensis]
MIVSCLKPYGVKSIAVFGSYVRGDFSVNSDIDILVEFSTNLTLYDIVGIELELSEALGIKVDLLTERAISPYLIDNIKKSLVKIYDE